MKPYLLFLFAVLFLFSNCKKDDVKPNGNYITINGDTKSIDPGNAKVEMTAKGYSSHPVGWQFYLNDEQFSHNIAGIGNDQLEVYVDVYDLNLSQNQYPIGSRVYSGSPQPNKAAIVVFLKKNQGWTTIKTLSTKEGAGTVNVTTENGKMTLDFQNVSFEGGYNISGRLIF